MFYYLYADKYFSLQLHLYFMEILNKSYVSIMYKRIIKIFRIICGNQSNFERNYQESKEISSIMYLEQAPFLLREFSNTPTS